MYRPGSENRAGFWLGVLLLGVYLATYSGLLHSVDEQALLATGETFLASGQLHANQMAWEQTWDTSQTAIGVDGNQYLYKRGLLLMALMLPALIVGKGLPHVGAVQCVLALAPLITAATGVIMWRVIRGLGYDHRTALVGTLAWGLGTMSLPYARTLFTEPMAALGLCLAYNGAIAWRRAPATRSGYRLLFVSGLGLAIVALTKLSNIVAALPFLIYFLVGLRREGPHQHGWRRLFMLLLCTGLPLLVAGSAYLFYNHAFFGRWFAVPLDSAEGFTTGLGSGVSGLLVSPGKGLVWYVPLVWLAPWAVTSWRRDGRLPDFLLALGGFATLLVLYALWFDWAGGRSWGPRFLVPAMPLLVVMVLPVIQRLASGATSQGWGIGLVLGGSAIVQLLGTLVDFAAREGQDLAAGAPYQQLLWSWRYSPIRTYWRTIFGFVLEPGWSQPIFWQDWTGWLAMLACLLVLALAVSNLRRELSGRLVGRYAYLAVGASLIVLVTAMVYAVRGDPRWEETSAGPGENHRLYAFLAQHAATTDLVLLDLIPYHDVIGRTQLWMNSAPAPPQYIGWLRLPEMTPADGNRLRRWMRPYARVWLSLQGTAPGAPESTTERWLDQNAYAGRHEWIGTQRVVEYLIPPDPKSRRPLRRAYAFQDGPILDAFLVQSGQDPGQLLVDLWWRARPAPETRFSVQALDAGGKVMAQVDGPLCQALMDAACRDRVGLAGVPSEPRLLLKVYDAGTGAVMPLAGDLAADGLDLLREMEKKP